MARTPFKMKSGNSPLYKNLGSSPLKQEKPDDKITKTKRSEKIRNNIEHLSQEEKDKIFMRNIEAFPHGRLTEGQQHRTNAPDLIKEIGTRSDSVRAVIHDFEAQQSKKKTK